MLIIHKRIGETKSREEETERCIVSKIDVTATGRIMAIIGRGKEQIICWSEILRMDAESHWPNHGHIKIYVKRERNTLRNKKWIMDNYLHRLRSPKEVIPHDVRAGQLMDNGQWLIRGDEGRCFLRHQCPTGRDVGNG